MDIVLVEPSRIGQKILSDMLETQNYSVVSFSDGLSAYEYVKAGNDIDVLLTSIEVAGKSGLELCWQIRDLVPDHKPIYIIVMSSSMDIDNAVMALDSGAHDFIRKPPIPAELYAKLRAAQRLITMQTQLHRLANFDSMTELLNRRAFMERAQSELDEAGREKPVSAIMLDVDRFKSVNDNFGHHAGDAAICAVADCIKHKDFVSGRLGGEEFAIILPGYSPEAAAEHAEGLRKTIEDLRIEGDDYLFSITSSFGVSEWRPTENDTLSNLLKRADEALYDAKEGGRNRVVVAKDQDKVEALAS